VIFFLALVVALLGADSLVVHRHQTSVRHRAIAAGLIAIALGVAVVTAPTGLVLQKCLGKLAMPLGLLWMALFAVALVFWHRRAISRAAIMPAAFAAAAWLALTCVANPYLADLALASLEEDFATIDPFAEGPFDVVVVLGGGTSSTPRGGDQLGSSGDRVALAARLYHRGRTPLLATSGTPIAGFGSMHDSVAATAGLWTDLGVDDAAILRVDGARNTREEAAAYAELVRARGFERVGLVTSALHLPRALRSFEREGVEVTPLPADFRGRPEWGGLATLIPDGTAAEGLSRATWEWVGAAVGR
jgi:uncharacterized SAM-binding protein YcdF (DUF218 family)